MADCVGVGLLRNFCFCNLAKFSSNFAKLKIILSKFHKTPNFDKIILIFAKFEENFAKRNKKFLENFANLHKTKFRSNPMQELSEGGSQASTALAYPPR